jgi:hypothetical protein
MAMSSKITSSASKDQLIIFLKTLLLTQKSHPLIFLPSNYLSILLTSLTNLTPNLLFFSSSALILLIFVFQNPQQLTKLPLASSRSLPNLLHSVLSDSHRQPPLLAPFHKFGSILPHNF